MVSPPADAQFITAILIRIRQQAGSQIPNDDPRDLPPPGLTSKAATDFHGSKILRKKTLFKICFNPRKSVAAFAFYLSAKSEAHPPPLV
jgi:hypothetical protein